MRALTGKNSRNKDQKVRIAQSDAVTAAQPRQKAQCCAKTARAQVGCHD